MLSFLVKLGDRKTRLKWDANVPKTSGTNDEDNWENDYKTLGINISTLYALCFWEKSWYIMANILAIVCLVGWILIIIKRLWVPFFGPYIDLTVLRFSWKVLLIPFSYGNSFFVRLIHSPYDIFHIFIFNVLWLWCS